MKIDLKKQNKKRVKCYSKSFSIVLCIVILMINFNRIADSTTSLVDRSILKENQTWHKTQHILTLEELREFCRRVDDEILKEEKETIEYTKNPEVYEYAFINHVFAATINKAYLSLPIVYSVIKNTFTKYDLDRASEFLDQVIRIRRFMAVNTDRYTHVKVEVLAESIDDCVIFRKIEIYAVRPADGRGWELA